MTVVAEMLIPGIAEVLRAYNLQFEKASMMERMMADIRKKTLLINLPERAETAKEDMKYILMETVQVVENLSL